MKKDEEAVLGVELVDEEVSLNLLMASVSIVALTA